MAWTTPRTWASGELVTAAIMNSAVRDNLAILKTPINDSGELEFTNATELTIASGVITVTQNYHKVDTEGAAASDDLDTITAGTNVAAGFILHLRVESDARTIVIKNGTGGADNIDIGADVTLDESYKTYSLVYDGSNWRPWSFAAAPTFAALSPLTTRGDVLYSPSGTGTGTGLAVGSANSVLHTDGTDVAWRLGYPTTVLSKTAAYTCTTADCGDNAIIKADPAGGAFTVELYAASGNAGKRITILKTTSNTLAVTVDGNGAETINGLASMLLYAQYDYVTVVCDGSGWFIEDEKITIYYKATLSAIQVIPTGAWTKILLDSVATDTAGAHASNCFTAPRAGYYLGIGQGFLDGYNNTTAGVSCWKNGSWTAGTQSIDNNGNYHSGPAQTIEHLAIGETIQLLVYQTRGVSINNNSALQNTSLRVWYLHS